MIDDDGEQFQLVNVPFLGENEIRKLSVKTLAETNRTATGETRVSSKKFGIRDNDIRRNYGNTIILREKVLPPVYVRARLDEQFA